MARHTTVDDYFNALPEQLWPVAVAARAAIDAAFPGPSCAIRWAHPTWSVGKLPICYLEGASRHLTLGFWKGASLPDPGVRLETSGHVMAHVKLRAVDDVDPELFAWWIRQAIELEQPN